MVTRRWGRTHLLVVFVVLWGLLGTPGRMSALPAQLSRSAMQAAAAPTAGAVLINEFVAANRSGLQDEDGDYPDWIELINTDSRPVDLTGWSLTDDPANPAKWQLPAMELRSQGYLIVFASGKDRRPTTASAALHTNFRLDRAGEYLALFSPADHAAPADALAPQFPRQYVDVSYGRHGAAGEWRYFARPTPGQRNDDRSAYLGVVRDVRFSAQRGYYDVPFPLTLSTDTPGATIRVTVTGVEPSETVGQVYERPITVYSTMSVRAIAYKPGYLSSPVATHTYIFPRHVIEQPAAPSGFPATWGVYNGEPVQADYEMDPKVTRDPRYRDRIADDLRALPAISLVTSRDDMFGADRGIYSHPLEQGPDWERPASVELILPDGSTGFQINAGVRIHGGESRKPEISPKHSFRLYFREEYGASTLEYPLFTDGAVTQFEHLVLRALEGEAWVSGRPKALYLRDQWMHDAEEAVGVLGVHGCFAHLYVDGLYWGLYNVLERIDDDFAASYLGGTEEDYDIVRGKWPGAIELVAGDTAKWDTLMALAGQGLASAEQFTAIQQLLDVPNLIEHMLVHIYAGTYHEWPYHNWFALAARAPSAGYKFLCWDNELTLDYVDEDVTAENAYNSPAYLYAQLRANPEFRLLFADHVHRHFFNGGAYYVDPAAPAWDPAHPERNAPAARLMQRARTIEAALVPESARWGDWKYGWMALTVDDHWKVERDRLLTEFFPQRSAIVLDQLRNAGLYPRVVAPVFSQHGGLVAPGFQLTMAAPAGDIYYTLDGSDPRVAITGAVAPQAQRYTGPVTLRGGETEVNARVRQGETWSALNTATFTAPQNLTALRITEIMYNPAGGQEYEFIEIKNTGPAELNISGVAFTTGIDFTFPPHTYLPAAGFAVLARNADGFRSRYPAVALTGVYNGALANEGERVVLSDRDGNPLVDMTYDDDPTAGWPAGADGGGYSLVIADLNGDPNLASTWRASTFPNGSPGADDPLPVFGGVVINEVLAHSEPPFEDAIELYNPSATAVDISGWFLSDSSQNLRKFRIPNGTVIAGQGYRVFYEYQFNPTPGAPGSFALSSLGEQLFLASANLAGDLTGYTTMVEFGASATNISFGRVPTSVGVDFVAQKHTSFGVDDPATLEEFRRGAGQANPGPLVGPVVINELMYHPPDGGAEFIELFNASDRAVPLYDLENPANTWRFTQGVSYTFPIDTVLPAQGYALVVGIAPADFRNAYAVPADVPIFGPYTGALSNGGERIELAKPVPPEGTQTPYVSVDAFTYDDADPWPSAPDGNGPSLERIEATRYANEPLSWAASVNGGTPGRRNSVSPSPTATPTPTATATPTPPPTATATPTPPGIRQSVYLPLILR